MNNHCTKCGAKWAGNAKFCPSCGKKLGDTVSGTTKTVATVLILIILIMSLLSFVFNMVGVSAIVEPLAEAREDLADLESDYKDNSSSYLSKSELRETIKETKRALVKLELTIAGTILSNILILILSVIACAYLVDKIKKKPASTKVKYTNPPPEAEPIVDETIDS